MRPVAWKVGGGGWIVGMRVMNKLHRSLFAAKVIKVMCCGGHFSAVERNKGWRGWFYDVRWVCVGFVGLEDG
jgi:hypothetical protein